MARQPRKPTSPKADSLAAPAEAVAKPRRTVRRIAAPAVPELVAVPKKSPRKIAPKAAASTRSAAIVPDLAKTAPAPTPIAPTTVIMAVEPPKTVASLPVPAARLTLVPAIPSPLPQRKVITMTQAFFSGAPFKGFEDFTAFGKDTFDALVASNAVLVKGMEDFSKEFVGLAQANLESAASHTKAMLSAKTLKDVVELNTAMSKASLDTMVAESSKLSELGMKLTSDALAPLNARVTAAVEKVMELSAA